MNPVVRNINTNDLYLYLGENKFRNMRTGQEGVVSDEAAQKTFRINLEATAILQENPDIEKLIKALGLRLDISDLGFITK